MNLTSNSEIVTLPSLVLQRRYDIVRHNADYRDIYIVHEVASDFEYRYHNIDRITSFKMTSEISQHF